MNRTPKSQSHLIYDSNDKFTNSEKTKKSLYSHYVRASLDVIKRTMTGKQQKSSNFERQLSPKRQLNEKSKKSQLQFQQNVSKTQLSLLESAQAKEFQQSLMRLGNIINSKEQFIDKIFRKIQNIKQNFSEVQKQTSKKELLQKNLNELLDFNNSLLQEFQKSQLDSLDVQQQVEQLICQFAKQKQETTYSIQNYIETIKESEKEKFNKHQKSLQEYIDSLKLQIQKVQIQNQQLTRQQQNQISKFEQSQNFLQQRDFEFEQTKLEKQKFINQIKANEEAKQQMLLHFEDIEDKYKQQIFDMEKQIEFLKQENDVYRYNNEQKQISIEKEFQIKHNQIVKKDQFYIEEIRQLQNKISQLAQENKQIKYSLKERDHLFDTKINVQKQEWSEIYGKLKHKQQKTQTKYEQEYELRKIKEKENFAWRDENEALWGCLKLLPKHEANKIMNRVNNKSISSKSQRSKT